MYKREKSTQQYPSFSSTLLDEIYRSLDDSGQGQDHSFYCRKTHNGSRKQSEEEKASGLRRGGLIEKWVEMKVNEKALSSQRKPPRQTHSREEFEKKVNEKALSSQRKPPRQTHSLEEFERKMYQQQQHQHQHHEAAIPFSNSSSSSDSSFGGFSSSETETISGSKSTRSSCFAPPRPAPVRTSIPPKSSNTHFNGQKASSNHEGYADYFKGCQDSKFDESFVKSKSKALKFYSNLRNLKQPISPGMRLSSFISSLFAKEGLKKKMTKRTNGVEGHKQQKPEQASTCSSASSFTRSCMTSKTNSPCSGDRLQNGMRRSVRFYPVSMTLDEDSLPCAQKISIKEYDHSKVSSKKLERALSNRYQEIRKLNGIEKKSRELEDIALGGLLNGYWNGKDNDGHARNASDATKGYYEGGNDEKDDDDDHLDGLSCSSSDLFELDHLTLMVDDELPVYETTKLPIKQ
ncbi:hypothetical protein Dimus_020338 [Dionaea muscipula]